MIRILLPLLLLCNLALAQEPLESVYEVTFSADFKPQQGVILASLNVQQDGAFLRQLDMAAPESKFSQFSGEGKIERKGDRLIWTVPAEGGSLHYQVGIDNPRGLLLDARLTPDWALLRLDDVFPAAGVRSLRGARSNSSLVLSGPEDWVFESQYGAWSGPQSINDENRRFDRPVGWLAAGILGVRREVIAHRNIAVASPRGQNMRRLDIIAFLRWTLPKLVKVFPQFPERLLIVGAEDEMWRGGLSGPGSIYLHTDRPLISENATSTLLHEMVHAATGQVPGARQDWVIEGLSEYYSLEILRRSGGLSKKRYAQALDWQGAWADRENGMLVSPSTGANTARAVMFFAEIQQELTTQNAGSLDTIVQQLLASGSITGDELMRLLDQALGTQSLPLLQTLQKYQEGT